MATIDEYRGHLLRQGASPLTVRHYTGALRHLQAHAGVPLEEVTPDMAAEFLNRPGLSQATRNGYYRWLRSYCAWSGATFLEDVRRPRAPRPRPRPASAAQVQAMLAACRSDEEYAAVLLACVALRRADVAGFRGEQLDVFEGTMRLRGKGGKDAVVPAPPSLVRHAARMPARGYWFPSPTRPGRHVTAQTVWARVVAVSDRAGIGHVPPHRLRAAYATEMVRAGVPLTTVQMCMRHSQLATTAHYIGVGSQEMADAVTRLPWAS